MNYFHKLSDDLPENKDTTKYKYIKHKLEFLIKKRATAIPMIRKTSVQHRTLRIKTRNQKARKKLRKM